MPSIIIPNSSTRMQIRPHWQRSRSNLFMILDENGNLLYGQVLSPDFTDERISSR